MWFERHWRCIGGTGLQWCSGTRASAIPPMIPTVIYFSQSTPKVAAACALAASGCGPTVCRARWAAMGDGLEE
eukprot:scaffold29296_cov144-Isochrysis_galbana.AAC.2